MAPILPRTKRAKSPTMGVKIMGNKMGRRVTCRIVENG